MALFVAFTRLASCPLHHLPVLHHDFAHRLHHLAAHLHHLRESLWDPIMPVIPPPIMPPPDIIGHIPPCICGCPDSGFG
jgi:hypothetical protein